MLGEWETEKSKAESQHRQPKPRKLARDELAWEDGTNRMIKVWPVFGKAQCQAVLSSP